MAGKGFDAYPIRIPESWAEARPWLERFIRETLSKGDVRNAVQGPGIAISSTPDEPATISASSEIDALLQASLVTVTAAGDLPNSRELIGGAGIVITDEGAGPGTVSIEVDDIPLSALPPIQPLSVLGVPYDSASSELALPIPAGANDRVFARVSNTLGFVQLTAGMFPANVVEYEALESSVQASLDLADTAVQPDELPPYYLVQEEATRFWAASELSRGHNIIGVRSEGETYVYLPHDLPVEHIVTVKDEVGDGSKIVRIY